MATLEDIALMQAGMAANLLNIANDIAEIKISVVTLNGRVREDEKAIARLQERQGVLQIIQTTVSAGFAAIAAVIGVSWQR